MSTNVDNQGYFSKQTEQNWLDFAKSGFKQFGDTVTNAENWESLYNSADKNLRYLIDEGIKLGGEGIDIAEPKVKAAMDALVASGKWSKDEVLQFVDDLQAGRETDFAKAARSFGKDAAEFGGNIMRAAPGVLSGGATFAIIMSVVKNMVGVHPDDGWFSFKGAIAAILGTPIAIMGALMVGGKVQNWWHDKYPEDNQTPQSTRNAEVQTGQQTTEMADLDLSDVPKQKLGFKNNPDVQMSTTPATDEVIVENGRATV